ncbi:uncharacterized protein LOC119085287 isoform X2 [Bradysia coprophila]|uniref:uncharacterized protein LOC119085287 isoform X2 n=1 Tax=Bradysia coprophila TaxID=38358 RepID=UPI00187DC836|nr:uncharacterized protein LOC119085287 isoform X2 [Bradysia coprophila]
MGTKVELLVNLLDQTKDALEAIQTERFEMNTNEASLKTKKQKTDENFQKLIKLKNEDYNTILCIQNEILAMDEESDDFRAYKDDGVADKIGMIDKCFDQTFAIVDQMKRETDFLENTSTECEDESARVDGSNDYFGMKTEFNISSGDSNSISNYGDGIEDFMQQIPDHTPTILERFSESH